MRISGGGRCNFTNIDAGPANFISQNPHFAKSALARYTPWDFIDLMLQHGLSYHEKTLGQLFCDQKSGAIIDLLLAEAKDAGADLWLETSVESVRKVEEGFEVDLLKAGSAQTVSCKNLVVATGGKSIPKMGATGLGYDIATQFGLPIIETFPGLVPFTFTGALLEDMKSRSGVSAPARVSCGGTTFTEGLLFTHRGLSGPPMLQISSYWSPSTELEIDFIPDIDLLARLVEAKTQAPAKPLRSALPFPEAVSSFLLPEDLVSQPMQALGRAKIEEIANHIGAFSLTPAGTEGYRTAEVTVGGIDTSALSSKTMAAKEHPGLYFIGEVVDVTGWLGGYNFQWAWASAAAAGRAISDS